MFRFQKNIYLRSKKSWQALIVSTLVIIALVAEVMGAGQSARSWVQTLLTPYYQAVMALETSSQNFWARWHEKGALHKELMHLRAQNQQLHIQVMLTQELMEENAALQGFLQTYASIGHDLIWCKIIPSHRGGRDRATLLLSAEHPEDLKVGDYVLSSQGIIGSIRAIHGRICEVILTEDLHFRLPVKLSAQARGVMQGLGVGKGMRLDYIAKEHQLHEGQAVVSSGLGGALPAGIPVGTIQTWERPSDQNFLKIMLEPIHWDPQHDVYAAVLTSPSSVSTEEP